MAMTDNSTHWQGRIIGRYHLIQKLGQGAMGEVWLAEDSQLRRQVAMKLLPATQANDQSYLQLFAYEARTAAALDHPHILAVHDFGEQATSDGEIITYLVMPYIGGGTLRHRIQAANGPLPTEEALHYLRQAAQAIDYAHSQRVLHRDIKPANMLLQQQWLWLSDFGIAKLLTSNTYRSQTVSGAGTPEYIAPEQAQGSAEPASDRYSLAIMAYQMFAGRLPFNSDNAYSIMLMQIKATPPMPRQFNPQIPLAVERVILRGMAKQPAERFASCTEFVQALEHAYKGDKRPATNDEVTALAPWSKRIHSTPLVPLIDAPIIEQRPNFNMTTAPIINQAPPSPYTPPIVNTPTYAPDSGNMPSRWPHPISERQQPVPEPQQPTPEQQISHTSRRKLLVGGATAAAALIIGGGLLGATYLKHGSLFSTQSQLKPTPTPPGPYNIMVGQPVLNLTGHSKTIWDVAWDPTGRYLATTSEDTHVMLWDVGSFLQKNSNQVQPLNQPLRNWKFAQPFSFSNEISWSADGRFLIVSDDEQNKIYIIDAFKPNSQPQIYVDAAQQNSFTAPSYVGISARPHSNTFTVVDFFLPSQIEIGLWKLGNTQAPIRKFTYSINKAQPQQNNINMTAWSSDGLLLAGINTFAQVIIWNGNTGKQLYFLDPPDRAHGQTVDFVLLEQIAWSPVDPYTIATFNLDVVAIWDVRKKQPSLQLSTDDAAALTPPPAKELNGVNWFPNVTGIAWSPNGRYIVAGYGRSTKLHLWDLQDTHARTAKDGTRLQKFLFPQNQGDFGHNNTITNVAWSPNGRYIASASMDTTVIVWQVDKG
jgi:serine/threonine protein kinase